MLDIEAIKNNQEHLPILWPAAILRDGVITLDVRILKPEYQEAIRDWFNGAPHVTIDSLMTEIERLRENNKTIAGAHVERVKYSEYLEDELEWISKNKNQQSWTLAERARQALHGGDNPYA